METFRFVTECESINILMTHWRETEEQRPGWMNLVEVAEGGSAPPDEADAMFLDLLFHDLRSPLSAVLGFSSVLREQAAGHAELLDLVGEIEESANRQMELLERVLDLMRVARGRLELARDEFSLGSLADGIRQAIGPVKRKGQPEVVVSLEGEQDQGISGDLRRISQAVAGLVAHLAHRAPDRPVSVEGAPDFQAGRLFLRIESRQTPGSPTLELCLAHQLIKVLGGSLRVRSNDSRLWFELTLSIEAVRPTGRPDDLASQLASLPAGIHGELEAAAAACDVSHLDEVIRSIAEDHPELAGYLSRLAESYAFGTLQEDLASQDPTDTNA